MDNGESVYILDAVVCQAGGVSRNTPICSEYSIV